MLEKNAEAEHVTLPELADWLCCSQRHLQRLLASGEGPATIRLGRRMIFRRDDVRQWLDRHTSGKTASVEPRGRGRPKKFITDTDTPLADSQSAKQGGSLSSTV